MSHSLRTQSGGESEDETCTDDSSVGSDIVTPLLESRGQAGPWYTPVRRQTAESPSGTAPLTRRVLRGAVRYDSSTESVRTRRLVQLSDRDSQAGLVQGKPGSRPRSGIRQSSGLSKLGSQV